MDKPSKNGQKSLDDAFKQASSRQYVSLFLKILSSVSLTFFLFFLANDLTLVFSSTQINPHSFLYFASSIFAFLFFLFISDLIAQNASSISIAYFKEEHIKRILSLPYSDFKHKHSATILAFLDESSKKLRVYFASFFRLKYQILFIPLYLLIVIFYFDLFAAITLLFVLLFIPLIMAILGYYTKKKSEEQVLSLSLLSERFIDSIRGLAVLKIFNQSDVFEKKLLEANENYRLKTMEILKIAFLNSLALDLFASISTAIVAVTIGLQLSLSKLDFKSGLFVLFVLPQFFMVFKQFANNYHLSKDAEILVNQMETIFSNLDEKTIPPKSFNKPIVQLQFENLGVRHENHLPLFEGLSADISSGSIVGIFGPSGYGKTSLIHALLGQIPYEGSIFVNEEKIPHLENAVSYLSQFPFFFSGSVIQNIQFFSEKTEKETMNDLIKKLNLEETLSKKELNHQLSNHYVGLSGGERKRIGIIRTLLVDKPIYIFDEPTENLDENNIEKLLEVLEEYKKKGKIIFFTSHVRDIEKYCDRIILFKGGQVDVT